MPTPFTSDGIFITERFSHIATLFPAYSSEINFRKASYKADRSPVTGLDFTIEKYLRTEIATFFPGDRILGEEEGGEIGTGRTWIIDPLDGTRNYVRHMPHCACGIALFEHDTVRAAGVLLPYEKRVVVAEKGIGCYTIELSGTKKWIRLRLSTVNHSAPIISFARGREPAATHAVLKGVDRLVPLFHTIRVLGSVLTEFAYHALGRIDLQLIAGVKPWDELPGVLLVEEAGAVGVDMERIANYPMKLYAHPELILRAQHILKEQQ